MKNKISPEEYEAALKELETAEDSDYKKMLKAVINRYNGKTNKYTARELRISPQAVSRLICAFKEKGLDYFKTMANDQNVQCMYTFESVYCSYRGSEKILYMESERREAERIFSSVLEKAYIPISFFQTPTDEYLFSEEGRELVIDILDNYKSDVYKQIRRHCYSEKTAKKYAFLISCAISNHMAICEKYPQDYYNVYGTDDLYKQVAQRIFTAIFRATHSLDALPGISCLDGLSDEINQNAMLILDDLVYVAPIIYSQFEDKPSDLDGFRAEWKSILTKIMHYRVQEWNHIIEITNFEENADVRESTESYMDFALASKPATNNPKRLTEERKWATTAKRNEKEGMATAKGIFVNMLMAQDNPCFEAFYEKLMQIPTKMPPEDLLRAIQNASGGKDPSEK